MKKLYTIILITILAVLMCASCSKKPAKDAAQTNSGKISIVCTIFPEYDWVRSIVGADNTHVDVTLLLDKGTDLHSYQPSVADIAKIAACDMLVYTGGESDEWIEDALKEAANKNTVAINLMEVLASAVKEEELVEGMQGSEHEHGEDADHHDEDTDHDEHEGEEAHHHDEDTDHDEHEHHHDEIEYDEHIWLSLRCAKTACSAITEQIALLDEAHADSYRANNAAYQAELDSLDADYTKAVNAARVHTILFGDRFPFRYLADDYELTYYAAFVGCSAETEASFETIVFLANKLDELNLPVVLTIENPRHTIAQTVVANSANPSRKISALNSMQSITAKDIDAGKTYLSIMKENLNVLTEALQ